MQRCSGAAVAEEGQVVALGQVRLPRKGAAQALDRGEFGLRVALDGQGTLQQVGVMLLEPDDRVLLRDGVEEAGALAGHQQAGRGDDLRAALAVVAPTERGNASS